MNREKRHILHTIVGEIRGNETEVREQLMDETDEEARAELVKATSSLIDAVDRILTATEVDGEARATAATRRPRKQRDAPDETEEP